MAPSVPNRGELLASLVIVNLAKSSPRTLFRGTAENGTTLGGLVAFGGRGGRETRIGREREDCRKLVN